MIRRGYLPPLSPELADVGQTQLFSDDCAQADAPEGKPVFWPRSVEGNGPYPSRPVRLFRQVGAVAPNRPLVRSDGGAQAAPEDDYAQADAPDDFPVRVAG